MQSPKVLLILSTRILHPQSRKTLATSPMNASISQIRKPHHAMHLQHLLLQLYATTSHCRSSHLPNGEHSVKKLISLLDLTIWAPCRTHTHMHIRATYEPRTPDKMLTCQPSNTDALSTPQVKLLQFHIL